MILILNGADFSAKNIGHVDLSDRTLVSISIEGDATVIGMTDAATYRCLATYDNDTSEYVTPTWLISAGSNYASIDANGKLTVKSGASTSAVTISASYQGKSATKNVTVTYNLGLDTFTLNAISESGNTGMTDAQKLALNTFFRNVGAFGSASTVWGKMDRVYIPMIVTDVTKAGHDFTEKGEDLTISSETFQLRSHGLASKLSNENSTNVPRLQIKLDKTNLSILHVMMEGANANSQKSLFRLGYTGDSSNNRVYMKPGINGSGTGYIMSYEHVTPSGAKLEVDCKLGGSTIADVKYKLCGFSLTGTDTGKILKLDGTFTTATYTNFSNVGTDTAKANAYMLGDASGKIATSDALSEGIIYMGKGLSESEMTTLKTATEILVNAFK